MSIDRAGREKVGEAVRAPGQWLGLKAGLGHFVFPESRLKTERPSKMQLATVPPTVPTTISSSAYHRLLDDLAESNSVEPCSSVEQIQAALGIAPDLRLPGLVYWHQPRGKYDSIEVRNQRVVVRLNKTLREKTIKHLHRSVPSAWYELNAGRVGVETDSLDQAILTLARIKAYDQGRELPERAGVALERYIMADN